MIGFLTYHLSRSQNLFSKLKSRYFRCKINFLRYLKRFLGVQYHQQVPASYIYMRNSLRENLRLDKIFFFLLPSQRAQPLATNPHMLHMCSSFISMSATIRPPEHAAFLCRLLIEFRARCAWSRDVRLWAHGVVLVKKKKKKIAQPCPKSHYICHCKLFLKKGSEK